MTIFIDSANIEEIQKWIIEYGVAKGVTTNQKIFFKEKGVNFEERIKEICEIAEPNLLKAVRETALIVKNVLE